MPRGNSNTFFTSVSVSGPRLNLSLLYFTLKEDRENVPYKMIYIGKVNLIVRSNWQLYNGDSSYHVFLLEFLHLELCLYGHVQIVINYR